MACKLKVYTAWHTNLLVSTAIAATTTTIYCFTNFRTILNVQKPTGWVVRQNFSEQTVGESRRVRIAVWEERIECTMCLYVRKRRWMKDAVRFGMPILRKFIQLVGACCTKATQYNKLKMSSKKLNEQQLGMVKSLWVWNCVENFKNAMPKTTSKIEWHKNKGPFAGRNEGTLKRIGWSWTKLKTFQPIHRTRILSISISVAI